MPNTTKLAIYRVSIILYRLFYSPLRRYPGPLFHAISWLPLLYHRQITGQWPYRLKRLHDQYGDIVRIAPDEISCIYPEAWDDIYGFRKPGQLELVKDPRDHSTLDQERREHNIIYSDTENHRRQRRLLAHAFSEQALRGQETLLQVYVDQLMQRLRETNRETTDITMWLNFATFDIMGDLGFGEPFGCLETAQYQHWIDVIFKSLRIGSTINAIRFYPLGAKLLQLTIGKQMIKARNAHQDLAVKKAEARISKGVTSQGDFMSQILKHNDEKGMSRKEMHEVTGLPIIVGSETTATALSGLVYCLTTNPEALKKAVDEVRSTFPSEDMINMTTMKSTPYLQACIEEALRVFPPVPGALHRVVPKGGFELRGKFLPEGVSGLLPSWIKVCADLPLADLPWLSPLDHLP